MGCNNCFGGCVDIISDQCVKYTGPSIELLDIENGDSLAVVELAITDYLLTVMDGTGINIVIEEAEVCALVHKYLNTEHDRNLVEVLTALVQCVCDLQEQIDAVVADIATLNDDYDVDCLEALESITDSTDTHDVLQAVINQLCKSISDITALTSSLSSYEKHDDLDTDIAAYIAANTSTKYYNRMVPYTVVEYYGDLIGKFDADGAGIVGTDWEQIHLCNGKDGTPDKRGRIPVGVVDMAGMTTDPVVAPNGTTNPTYTVNTKYDGANAVQLQIAEMPSHNHDTTVILTPNPHGHRFELRENGTGDSVSVPNYPAVTANSEGYIQSGWANVEALELTLEIVNPYKGGGGTHNNIPPVLACYYIMYIPSTP